MTKAIIARRLQVLCLLIWNAWFGYTTINCVHMGGAPLPAPCNAIAVACWFSYFGALLWTLPPKRPTLSNFFWPGWHWLEIRHARLIVMVCLGLAFVWTGSLYLYTAWYGPPGKGWWGFAGVIAATLPLTVAPRAVHPLDKAADEPVPF